MMRRKTIAVLLALCMALCVGIPAAGAITAEDMENAPVLIPGEVATVNITTGGQYAYFKVVPEFSCQYTFYSTGSRDTVVYLYDAEGTQTATDDDSGDNYNFKLVVTLTEGETYYLGARIWGSGNTGSYPLYSEVHSVDAWTTVTPATCTDPGEETAICTICGEEITREIEPLGHDWTNAVSNYDGTHDHTCARCGITQTDPCDYEEQSEGGFTMHTCRECGYSYTDELTGAQSIALWDFEEEPVDWTFVDADGDGYNWEWYSTSSAYEGDYVLRSDSWYNGSALTPDNWAISPAFSLVGTDSAQLSVWSRDSSYDDIIALYAGTSMNVDDMTMISDYISPTSSAYQQYTADLSDFVGKPTVYIAVRHFECSDQYYVYVDYVEVSATYAECTDHVLVEVPAAEATCTEGGHCAYWECENCGRMFYDEDGTEPAMPGDVFNAPALGHDWGEAVSNNDGTHTYTCDRCHETRTEDCTFETVTEDGVITEVCTECGYTVLSDLIAYWDFEDEPFDWWFYDADGDGYNWDWVYDEGWTVYDGVGMIHSASYINNIGALSPDNIAVSPAFSLAECTDATLSAWARGQDSSANGEVFAFYAGTTYNPDDFVQISEDYTTDGEYREYTADLSEFVGEPVVHIAIRHYNVSDMYWLNIDDVSIKGTPVDPCETGNHSMTYVPAKEPTETEDGNIAYYICDVCGYYYLDEEGTQPVSAADVILPGGYPVTVDENIEHGTVVTFVTRAKPGDFVPLNVTPDQGAVLEYLAYVDEDGENALVPGPKAKEGDLQIVPQKSEGKLAPNAKIGTPAGLTKSGAPVSVVKAETEIEENYFIMPGSAVTVIAEFGPKYTVTLDPGDAGGDLLYITSFDEGVWAEDLSSSTNGQFSPYSVGRDAFKLPDNPFTWNNHTFVNWLLVLDEQSAEANPGDAYYANSYTLIAQWTEDELEDGYYLIGPDWTFTAINADEKFEVNPDNGNEYMLSTALSEGDEIKVVHLTNNVIDAWYPDGEDTQYHVDAAHAGSVNIYFQTTYNNAWSAFGGYFYIEAGAEPVFKSQNLILDGLIGVSFNMELPEISGVDYDDSYMTFSVEHGTCTERVDYAASKTKKSGTQAFVCYVSAVMMAEPITATFHYTQNGTELTVEKTYAIKEYFEAYDENPGIFDEKTQTLIESVADYGHYVQAMLAAQKGWTLGDGEDAEYKLMDMFYTTSYDIGTVTGAVADQGLTFENDGAAVKKLNFTAVFDSATTLRLLVKLTSGYTGDFTAAVDDGEPYAPTMTGGWYHVDIENVAAHELSHPYEVVITTDGGSATLIASALSYVKIMIGSTDSTIQNAMAALYSYSAAADAYKDQ